MVHALELARGLLKPEGQLLNIHSLPVPSMVEIHDNRRIRNAGWLLDKTDFESERSAFKALAEVISKGIFVLDDELDFSYHTHAKDLQELLDWLKEWWGSAFLPEKTLNRIEDMLEQSGQHAHVVLNVPTRVIKLRCN